MPRQRSLPPAILQFVKSTNSATDDSDHDDDRATLIPSYGSSFNLTGDSEVLKKNHNSSNSSSQRSGDGGSGTGGSGRSKRKNKRHHSHHPSSGTSGSRGEDTSRMSRESSSGTQLSGRSWASGGSNTANKKSYSKQESLPNTSSHRVGSYQRQFTDPLPGNNNNYINNSKPEDGDNAFFLGGYESSDSPPAVAGSTSYDSTNIAGGGSGGNGEGGGIVQHQLSDLPESNESVHSGKTNRSSRSVARSEKSGRSRKSSNQSVKSSVRRRKLRRQERVREWEKKRSRRRFLGKIALTVVYTLLGAYTLIVTAGPLVLHFWMDETEWCPYYHDGIVEDSTFQSSQHINNLNRALNSDFSYDRLQRQHPRQQQSGEIIPHGNENIHIKKYAIEEQLSQQQRGNQRRSLKTSKDVHTTTASTKMFDNSINIDDESEDTHKYENPDYDTSPCRHERLPHLLYLTLEECDLSRRMASSVLFGGFIGYERRASDRPAGIRTMALVSLGSCFFTLSSQLAFRDSPMGWDSSRVSAAIPSGVGFLGAGLIWKGTLSDGSGGEVHQVHGITTAASVWLAAAVGVGAGGALYAVTAYSTALVILVLRFGPRLYFQHDRGFDYDEDEEDYEDGEDDEKDDESEDASERKFGDLPIKESIPSAHDRSNVESGLIHRHDYEMQSFGDTSKHHETKGYGSTAPYAEDDAVARLLQEDQRRHLDRLNQTHHSMMGISKGSNNGPQFLSWLTKLTPWKKERLQPENPYQALSRDRDIARMMKKRKSMSRMSSRPSFCT